MNKRNSKFEILRIISMILIVAHHFSVHGMKVSYFMGFNYNRIIIDILSFGGKLGVNLFIIISAYFIVDTKFKFRRLLKLICETWFYSIIILILFSTCLSPYDEITDDVFRMNIFPIIYGKYWFVTDYILLMIFSPFLNIFINNLDKNTYKKLIILLILLSVVFSGTIINTFSDLSNNLMWFIILYLIVGYLKKHCSFNDNYKKYLMKSIAAYLLLIVFSIIINILNYKCDFDLKMITYYQLHGNNIFIFVASIELFIACLQFPDIYNSFINKISSCMLGVYLIHDNELMRPYLWNTIFNTKQHYLYSGFLLYSLRTILIVFVTCTIIDFARQVLFERFYMKIANKLYDKLEKKFKVVDF